jgi:CheY-like chemotaxis protein
MARILLVEDEMLLRELAYEDLSDAGFEVVAAGNGDEALAILQGDCAFDLLFTDIKMPGTVDGYGLATEAGKLIPDLMVIYASGLADAGTRSPNERTLSKPYSREMLLALLTELKIAPSRPAAAPWSP